MLKKETTPPSTHSACAFIIIKGTHILAQVVALFFLPQHHAYFAHLLFPPSRMHCSRVTPLNCRPLPYFGRAAGNHCKSLLLDESLLLDAQGEQKARKLHV